jgi:peptide/nickel transport system ATP-binding protein
VSGPLLEVENLSTTFFTRDGAVPAVDDISFSVERGEILGIVGESGSGKSVTAYSILGLVPTPGKVVGGKVRFAGDDLRTASPERLRALRGDRIAMIFQDPAMTLNPVLRVGVQITETILAHRKSTPAKARAEARDALGLVGVPSPEERLDAYPFEMSGGMRQRVSIAIALINNPDLVIADEPTTALDVTIQSQILYLVKDLCRRRGAALLWITHDLGVVGALAQRVLVMYAGRAVETGSVDSILDRPRHPYTAGLIASLPGSGPRGTRLQPIPGMMQTAGNLPRGCAFKTRCNWRGPDCDTLPAIRRLIDGRDARCHRLMGEAAP